MKIYVESSVYQGTSQASVLDLTPPTFAGINFLDVESRGQIRAGWAAGSDATGPIRYEVYIQAGTATGLFNTANITGITNQLSYDIYTLPNGSFLVNGTTYYVGVRALDGVSNRDGNTVSLNVISTGVLTSIDVYECKASFSTDLTNDFRITMWANKNDSLAKSPGAVLGTASYQVYDKAGNPISGMSGSGISANAQGLYVATGVDSLLSEVAEHYQILVTISVDGENRSNFISLETDLQQYEVDGTGGVDENSSLVGSFWVLQNEKVVTTNLGTGSYQVYTADGTLIPGFAETGITPDGNGFFAISPVMLPPGLSNTLPYIVAYTVMVNGTQRTKRIIFAPGTTTYTCRVTFSINALNQLEATFWTTINDQLAPPALLGTASYQIYDKSGNAVSGLTQSGITPDARGLFHTTPISAALLTDLTHYTAIVTIEVAGQDRTVAKGFSLLGA